MEKFKALKEMITGAENNASKFYEKNNHAAGTRLRKTMQEIKLAESELRKEVTEKKKA